MPSAPGPTLAIVTCCKCCELNLNKWVSYRSEKTQILTWSLVFNAWKSQTLASILSKGKGGYPYESTLTTYTIMYLLYMAYEGQYGGIFRKQVVGYSPKATHIFPLILAASFIVATFQLCLPLFDVGGAEWRTCHVDLPLNVHYKMVRLDSACVHSGVFVRLNMLSIFSRWMEGPCWVDHCMTWEETMNLLEEMRGALCSCRKDTWEIQC